MGSLMAGWDSPIHDPISAEKQRNKSLTKEEIASFWRSKKEKEEQDYLLKASYRFLKENQVNEKKKLKIQRHEDKESMETFVMKNGWWICSMWAFLNQPEVISLESSPTSNYSSQFHVAKNPHSITKGIRA